MAQRPLPGQHPAGRVLVRPGQLGTLGHVSGQGHETKRTESVTKLYAGQELRLAVFGNVTGPRVVYLARVEAVTLIRNLTQRQRGRPTSRRGEGQGSAHPIVGRLLYMAHDSAAITATVTSRGQFTTSDTPGHCAERK